MKHTVREVRLRNGGQGLLVHVPNSQVMYFDFNFRAGDYLCPHDKIELAHMLEHMVLGANQSYRSSEKFSLVFSRNGAYGNAATDTHHIDYEAECADFEWQRVLELLMLSLSKPLFLESEFDSEFKVVQEELIQRSNDYRDVLALEVKKAAGFTPYTYTDGMKSMKNIGIDDLREFYRQTHFASNMRFIIAGDTYSKQRKIIAMLDKLDLPDGPNGRLKLPPEKVHGEAEPIMIEKRSVSNLYFLFKTFHNQVISQPERDSLIVLNDILSDDFSSRIFGQARRKGLIYGVHTGSYVTANSSVWMIDGQVSADNSVALFNLIAREVRKILRGKLQHSELKRAKQKVLGRHQLAVQTIANLATGYQQYFWDDKIQAYDIYPERIKSVTRQRILDVFTRLFQDQDWCLGLLGFTSQRKQNTLHSKMSSIWRT